MLLLLQNPEDIRNTFLRVKEIGYENVQLSGAAPTPADTLKRISEETGMRIVCTHNPFDRIGRDTDALIDDGFTDAKNIAPTMSGSLGVMDCIDARNELLRMFYADIGVRFTKDKKERMIESEVSSDNQMLLFNISDMLHQREKASEEINKLFGLNTSVKLSKEFSLLSSGRSEEDANIK